MKSLKEILQGFFCFQSIFHKDLADKKVKQFF
jgi:hypothetical protein